jgi:hypothetical protein
MNRSKGFGLRDQFSEEKMDEIMSPDAAKRIGYRKVLDYRRSKHLFLLNMAVVDHATAELKPKRNVFSYRTILLANFSFLLRVIMYHLILVALCNCTIL